MTNEPKCDSRNRPIPVVELSEDQLNQVSGGVRDAATGHATGKRTHELISIF